MTSAESTRPAMPEVRTDGPDDPIAVGVTGDETDALSRARAELEARDGIVVETIADPADGDRVDCLVRALADAGDPTDPVPRSGEQEPGRPQVVVREPADAPELDGLLGGASPGTLETWTPVESPELLVGRVRLLVSGERASTLARRAMFAVESATDGIAIVAPDDTIQFANRLFAQTFERSPEELIGRPWQTLYAADETDRLATEALAAVEDGWRWVGACEIRRGDGDRITVQTSITGGSDGSLVFSVYRQPDD